MKAYTKLTVVMCCQIVARKSLAPSSGNFRRRSATQFACGQDLESLSKKSFSKILITPIPRPRPEFRECVTNGLSTTTRLDLLAGVAGRSIIENISLIFFVLNLALLLKHHGDL